ncbi:hypothetical protein QQF64_018355 [Cirrhinus molitorella]|uniref:Peptidase S1 domain-containing protein n=1 Tax=Cirrhinus molitorella TaxID=172907 RepID=A0ABR3LFS3_9TELE
MYVVEPPSIIGFMEVRMLQQGLGHGKSAFMTSSGANITVVGRSSTKDWVLTGAHCFDVPDSKDILMYFGRVNQFGSNPYETSRTVSRIIIHPDYGHPPFDKDIALVQLSSSVPFSDYISRAVWQRLVVYLMQVQRAGSLDLGVPTI